MTCCSNTTRRRSNTRAVRIYANRAFTPAPKSPVEADYLVDVCKEGLETDFFERAAQWRPGDLPDGAPSLSKGWGSAEKGDDGTFRAV